MTPTYMNPERLRARVQLIKTWAAQIRQPPIELPADSFLEDLVKQLYREFIPGKGIPRPYTALNTAYERLRQGIKAPMMAMSHATFLGEWKAWCDAREDERIKRDLEDLKDWPKDDPDPPGPLPRLYTPYHRFKGSEIILEDDVPEGFIALWNEFDIRIVDFRELSSHPPEEAPTNEQALAPPTPQAPA